MHALLKLQKTNIATSLCKIKKMGEKEKEGNNRGRGGGRFTSGYSILTWVELVASQREPPRFQPLYYTF